MSEQVAHVGTYTDEESEGIYTYRIDVEDDVSIRSETVTQLGDNPSFLAVHPSGEFLYAVQEVEDGRVTAFRRNADGSLSRLNQESSGASGPCHCSVHPSGEYLLVAHYTGGAVSILPIRADGEVAPPAEIHRHEGLSVHPERQTPPHPHSITPGPNGRHLYVPDLGTDEIVVYGFEDGSLERTEAVSLDDGAGPRHLTFHPNEQFAYVINELDSTVTVLERTDRGSLVERGTVSTLPADYHGENITADIHVHPSGEWVYGSNRGHDSIVTFAVDRDGGELMPVDYVHTGGEWPRNFALDATGQVLFAENQHSNTILAFRIEESTGEPIKTDTVVENPAPTCMLCLPYDDGSL